MKKWLRCLLAVLLMGMLVGCREKTDSYSCGNMRFELPHSYGFRELENPSFDLVLYSEDRGIGVWINYLSKEELNLYMGMEVDFRSFVDISLVNVEVISDRQVGDHYLVTYKEAENDYMVYVYNLYYDEGGYYYSLMFDCLESDYDVLRSKFEQWSEKVRFEG